jgi:hypothetical protein
MQEGFYERLMKGVSRIMMSGVFLIGWFDFARRWQARS